MLMKYQCCKCRKIYNWYDGVYQNPEYDSFKAMKAKHNNEEYPESGIFIDANAFVLKKFEPVPEKEGEKFDELEDPHGNLDGMIINLCEDCMRELLMNIYPENDNANCFETI